MELITGINRVMAYTEQNLKENLDSGKLAQLSGCSYADFQRVFSLLNHMSYLEYQSEKAIAGCSGNYSQQETDPGYRTGIRL